VALRAFEAARDAALRPLPTDEQDAVRRSPEVAQLFQHADWSPEQAALAGAWARAHLHMEPAALQGLREAEATLHARSGGGCPEALRRAPDGCLAASQAAAESAPLPSLPASRQEGETAATEKPLFDDAEATGQGNVQNSFLCEERDKKCVGPASLLRIGGTQTTTYGHVAVVHIDLGGPDEYVAEAAGTAAVGLRNVPQEIEDRLEDRPAGQAPFFDCYSESPTQYVLYAHTCLPPRFCRYSPNHVCIPVAVGRGSYSIDLGGKDHYQTPGLEATQGATGPPPDQLLAQLLAYHARRSGVTPNLAQNGIDPGVQRNGAAALNSTAMGWASILLDASGDDVYLAKAGSQGSATHGVGLLIDAGGADQYDAGPVSQGASTANTTARATRTTTTSTTDMTARTSAAVGGLFDLGIEGDRYHFSRQGSLANEAGAGTAGTAVFLDAGGNDTYSSSFAIDPAGIRRAVPGDALRMQGRLEDGASGLALFLDAGIDRDTYLAQDLAGQPVDLSRAKNDQWQPNGGSGTGAGLFIDGGPVDQDDLVDGDRDGALTYLERQWGTDPEDPGSNPGNVFWALAHANQTDPDDPPGLDRPGPWLAPMDIKARLGSSTLYVPGLAIGGRANDLYTVSAPFLVDLGGNDHYTGRNAGGTMPKLEGGDTARPPGTD
ncbi:MAG TPA: hypothetical protein VHI93_01270, partial [Candidatus Thermoplasmatota archaeon]|nr:hypothetical protein [Candidatus Thermoplasmatota archaeon]